MRDLYFNGIDGDDGEYLVPKMPLEEYAARARKAASKMSGDRGVKSGVKTFDLSSAGWGVVFPAGLDPRIRAALEPLVEHRRQCAASKIPKLFKEAFLRHPRESKRAFLARHGAMPAGPVDPVRMPYYLLLVGDLRQIPYSFQYDLGVQYAVGRVFFDTPQEYRAYAESVVRAETTKRWPRRAVLLGSHHPNDPATDATISKLVGPLQEQLIHNGDWRLETLAEGAATKTAMARVCGGEETPGFLMTVSHGLGFKRFDDERKRGHQGQLILSDWPGRGSGKRPIDGDYCFGAEDLGDGADVAGMITLHLACWSAGTPRWDYFLEDRQIAKEDFVARLPQRLLAHPNGGALAVVGHVDRAMLDTFSWEGLGHTVLYESVFIDLMSSQPLGWAMRHFGEYAADQANDILNIEAGVRSASDEEFAAIWASYQDARGYVILGDPAVRLEFSENGA